MEMCLTEPDSYRKFPSGKNNQKWCYLTFQENSMVQNESTYDPLAFCKNHVAKNALG